MDWHAEVALAVHELILYTGALDDDSYKNTAGIPGTGYNSDGQRWQNPATANRLRPPEILRNGPVASLYVAATPSRATATSAPQASARRYRAEPVQLAGAAVRAARQLRITDSGRLSSHEFLARRIVDDADLGAYVQRG
jgi:hypothetical protein